MSAEIVSLAQVREENSPHWSGEVYCVGCHHTWVGVAPVGTDWVECPQCHLPKGTHRHPFGAQVGDLVLSCNHCGGEALTSYKRKGLMHVICMGCGTNLTDAFYGE